MASMSRWLVGSSSSSRSGSAPARAPAARAGAIRRRACRRGHPTEGQAREHGLDALFDAPAVGAFEVVLQASELLQAIRCAFLSHLDGGAVIARDQVAQVAQRVGDDVEHRTARSRSEHPDRGVRAEARARSTRIGVRGVLAADDAQQCRLSGAVPADHRYPFPSLNPQGGFAEQREVAERD